MKLETLYVLDQSSFREAVSDIDWRRAARAIDSDDPVELMRVIRSPLDAMAEAIEDEAPRENEEEFERRLQWEALPVIK